MVTVSLNRAEFHHKPWLLTLKFPFCIPQVFLFFCLCTYCSLPTVLVSEIHKCKHESFCSNRWKSELKHTKTSKGWMVKPYKVRDHYDERTTCYGVCYTDLKDTVEKLDGNMDDNEQAVIQLQQENAKLNKLLHEKEEQLKRRWVAIPMCLLYICMTKDVKVSTHNRL